MEVESFSPYIYVPIPWAKHTKTTVDEPLVWKISRVVNYIFPPLSLAVVVALAAVAAHDRDLAELAWSCEVCCLATICKPLTSFASRKAIAVVGLYAISISYSSLAEKTRRCHHGSSSKHVRCHDFKHRQATGRPDEIDVFIH
jgi:hypothetical protein